MSENYTDGVDFENDTEDQTVLQSQLSQFDKDHPGYRKESIIKEVLEGFFALRLSDIVYDGKAPEEYMGLLDSMLYDSFSSECNMGELVTAICDLVIGAESNERVAVIDMLVCPLMKILYKGNTPHSEVLENFRKLNYQRTLDFMVTKLDPVPLTAYSKTWGYMYMMQPETVRLDGDRNQNLYPISDEAIDITIRNCVQNLEKKETTQSRSDKMNTILSLFVYSYFDGRFCSWGKKNYNEISDGATSFVNWAEDYVMTRLLVMKSFVIPLMKYYEWKN